MAPQQTEPAASSSLPLKIIALELFCASLAVLFQELTLIRWFPGQVRVLAYFPNLILISAFLGLGIGCLISGRRSLLWLWPASLLALVGLAYGMSQVVFTQASSTEHLWLLYYDMPKDAPVMKSIELPIVLAFIISTVTFVPLGQIVGHRLAIFRERSSSLWGYCWDLLGSLIGVVCFAVVSFLFFGPLVWFSLLLLVVGLVFFRGVRRAGPYLALGAGVLLVVSLTEKTDHYSPYYAISAAQGKHGVIISTNGSFHQYAMAMERGRTGLTQVNANVRACYHAPYRALPRPVKRALVLGAGTGNDVATLLDQGVEHIDAVEIDPIILKLGKESHPSRPYASERVVIHNTDARSFLNDTDQVYDLIVFGTLDSQTRLSALSNVRLDNFVYTIDSIRKARSRLSSKGGMVMMFFVQERYIHEHIQGILARAFGKLPISYRVGKECYLFNHVYLVGPAFDKHRTSPPALSRHFFDKILPGLEIPTDDWPFLYLQERGVSTFYLTLMAIFTLLAVFTVAAVSRDVRASLRRWRNIDVEMMLFGAAFLLMETTFVTSMNLVWGATWITSAVVFGSILATVLAATAIMQRWPMNWWVSVGGLITFFIITYLIPINFLVGRGVAIKLLLSILFVGGPIFFASVCFALRFRRRESAGIAFGWNLLGAVGGGLLEFLSMLVGFKALSLLALCFYLGVVLLRQVDQKHEVNSP